MEEKPAELPISPQETQIQAPSFLERISSQKKKILIGLGSFLGVLILVGAVFGVYKLSQRQVSPEPQPTPKPTSIATPTPDETANWETYTNTKYGYLIKYPQDVTVKTDETQNLVLFEFPEEGKWFSDLSIKHYQNPEGLDPQGFYQKSFNEGKIEAEKKNWPPPSEPMESKVTKINNTEGFQIRNSAYEAHQRTTYLGQDEIMVAISFYDENPNDPAQEEHLTVFNLILSTFKFLEEETPQPISIPNDWQEYTATDPDFGIKTTLSLPPGYSFRFTGSEFTLQNSDATELWDYSTSVFRKGDVLDNFYKGESRRAWYQDYLEGKFLEEKPVLFEEGKINRVAEHSIGSQSYLELTVSGGVNYVGEIEKHFIFVQNQILHIIRPASDKANSTEAQIPTNIGIIFYSLKPERTE